MQPPWSSPYPGTTSAPALQRQALNSVPALPIGMLDQTTVSPTGCRPRLRVHLPWRRPRGHPRLERGPGSVVQGALVAEGAKQVDATVLLSHLLGALSQPPPQSRAPRRAARLPSDPSDISILSVQGLPADEAASLPRHAALQGCWGLWGLACWELHRPRQAWCLPSPAQVQTSARTRLPSRAVGQASSLTVGAAAACVLELSACSPGLSAVVQDGSVLRPQWDR